MSNLKYFFAKIAIKAGTTFTEDYINYLAGKSIVLYYSDFNRNWGDWINPFLFELITQNKVISAKRIFNIRSQKKIYGIGSILGRDLKNAVIFGSGFIKPIDGIKNYPHHIISLRGKLTAKILFNNSIPSHILFGDPAILFAHFYQPDIKKKYDLGIIPHYTDLGSGLEKFKNDPNIRIISPIENGKNPYRFIDEICSCNQVISSSLHGLIIADAYQIPSARFILNNKTIGGDFKFRDYYSGVGIENYGTLSLSGKGTLPLRDIEKSISKKDLEYLPAKMILSLNNFLEDFK